ncbi:isoniazid inducible protein IniC [Allosaccharopolyspora coralli]|uniref:Isoniazid inducible protein IniC n=1 Tax=Allosaccharopolyspora coralli TaxID=2665642 RepID=A0A5Q3Q4E2_9PSEU|nr:dynamin family protein [Allosaccharopolyspora coralli]QGK68366.1 isoniazid inducible protein IniC [Allosaccharopolyspora coralli]
MTNPHHQAEPDDGLLPRARALLTRTMTFYRDDPRTSRWLRERFERLEHPLRLAVTGRVKSGKSTLINALIGEPLAPTDAEERTQVNTLYRYGPEPRITVHTPHGAEQNIPVTTLDVGTIRDLQHWRPDEVSRLVIESPAPGLQAITLSETPGVSSSAVQETGRGALAQILSEADGLLYLTRHPHQTDVQFLHSVHELHVAQCAPINTILVLSRADETGSGGTEALPAADKIARRYRDDPRLRAFSQYVIPVVGLLGQAASSLTPDEVAALGKVAALPDENLEALLLSADRFARNEKPESVPRAVRLALFEKLGRFGLQRAVTAIRDGVGEPKKIVSTLLDDSRLNDLHEAVHQQFIERQDALRARSVLMALDMVLRANPRPGSHQLRAELERILASAHEWPELRLISALRSGQIRFGGALDEEAQQLLGGAGDDLRSRLGQASRTSDGTMAHVAGDALTRWRYHALDPGRDLVHREAARTVLRTCERLVRRTHSGT